MPDMMQGYVDVAERLQHLKAKHPEATLQPVDPARPFWFEQVDGSTFLVYAAACYRTPDDPTPGIGTAWDPVPGRTSFTRGSELQNAETSAWGRAIVAALAADTKRGIASQQEVEAARRNANDTPKGKAPAKPAPVKPDPRLATVAEQVKQLDDHSRTEFKALFGEKPSAISDPAAALAWLTERVEPF